MNLNPLEWFRRWAERQRQRETRMGMAIVSALHTYGWMAPRGLRDEVYFNTGTLPSLPRLYTTLNDLEDRGLIEWRETPATEERGWCKGRTYRLTSWGKQTATAMAGVASPLPVPAETAQEKP